MPSLFCTDDTVRWFGLTLVPLQDSTFWIVHFNYISLKSSALPQYLSETLRTLHFRTRLVTEAPTSQEDDIGTDKSE